MGLSGARGLRERVLGDGDPLLLLGAPNALTGRLLEDEGAEAVYVSGAGVTNAFMGAPDLGLLDLSMLVAHVEQMRDVVEVPLIVDADTGFGNAVNVHRVVRMLESAGASGIQIEDQVNPKKCGHFDNKAIIAQSEMVQKVRAAVDCRRNPGTLIIARTDAIAIVGIEAALERAQAYLDAGADVVFVEAPRDIAEIERIPRSVSGPVMINMVEGGITPIVPLKDLHECGYRVVLYANTALRAAISGMRPVVRHLLYHGDSLAIASSIATWDDRQALVRKYLYDELDDRYAEASPPAASSTTTTP